uniref:Uncharacterized protein n=1 Tax=Compsopogon caeruleus TaxID=31354 RepID=A0A7S1T5B2_9RHOD|mmetsp:Transcript_10914/g.21814  ORF Transcript_10914/g.21814 Transcript_10914/m.21814 type:complete len:190 (+) Transcript_10914:202-771(+)
MESEMSETEDFDFESFRGGFVTGSVSPLRTPGKRLVPEEVMNDENRDPQVDVVRRRGGTKMRLSSGVGKNGGNRDAEAASDPDLGFQRSCDTEKEGSSKSDEAYELVLAKRDLETSQYQIKELHVREGHLRNELAELSENLVEWSAKGLARAVLQMLCYIGMALVSILILELLYMYFLDDTISLPYAPM